MSKQQEALQQQQYMQQLALQQQEADRFVAFFVLLTTDDLQTRAGNAVLDLSTELQMPLSNCSWLLLAAEYTINSSMQVC